MLRNNNNNNKMKKLILIYRIVRKKALEDKNPIILIRRKNKNKIMIRAFRNNKSIFLSVIQGKDSLLRSLRIRIMNSIVKSINSMRFMNKNKGDPKQQAKLIICLKIV